MRVFIARLMCCLTVLCITNTARADGKWQDAVGGARMWNPNPIADETIMWTGKVDSDGYATGRGLRIWLVKGKPVSVDSVDLERGKSTAKLMVTLSADGGVGASARENGQRVAYDIDFRKQNSVAGTKWTVSERKGLASNKITFATTITFHGGGEFSMLQTFTGGGITAGSRQSSGTYTQRGNEITAVVAKGVVAQGGRANNTMRFELQDGILLMFESRGSDTNSQFRPVR